MSDRSIKQIRFTLNLRYKEDKDIYEILKKQSNMSSFIKLAISSYCDSSQVSKSDLKLTEDKIIREIRDVFSSSSEKNINCRRAEKKRDKHSGSENDSNSNIKNLI